MSCEINKVNYDGFDAVEVVTPVLKLVLIYEVGPRIAHFGKKDGENLLYWKKDEIARGEWKLYGGHRVWITRPFADESEDTYLPDNELCELTMGENWFEAISPMSPVNKLQKGMRVEVLSETDIKVTNFIINAGELIYSGAVWNPTCVVPDGKKIVVPLGDDNATWDVVKMVIPRVFAGNVTMLEDSQITFEGNDMILRANGKCVKRVLQAKQGIVKLVCDGYEFIKFSEYNKYKSYPFEGCNIAIFNGDGNFMAEMETFGHEGEISPGAKVENEEVWKIHKY